MRGYYYLAVTADKYELPCAVSDSIPGLARQLGVESGYLYPRIKKDSWKSKQKVRGDKKGFLYYKVPDIDETAELEAMAI